MEGARIAYDLPMGGVIKYDDQQTLRESLSHRVETWQGSEVNKIIPYSSFLWFPSSSLETKRCLTKLPLVWLAKQSFARKTRSQAGAWERVHPSF